MENHLRCRFFPHCAIHKGEPRPSLFTPHNRTEMVQMYRSGWHVQEIARAFDADELYVRTVLGDARRRRVPRAA